MVGRHNHPSAQIQLNRTPRHDADERLATQALKRLVGKSGGTETGWNDTKEAHGGS
jgi:hypothetical protein